MVSPCFPSTVRRILSCIAVRDDPSLNRSTLMSNLTIEVWDATGNKKQLVELPADAPVNRVIAVLVDKMNLPRYSPDGQLMSYKFHHKASGRQLLDDQTLASADIHSGDVLRLQPEITAGLGRGAIAVPRDSRGNEVLPVLRRADSGRRTQVSVLPRVSRSGATCRLPRAGGSTGPSCHVGPPRVGNRRGVPGAALAASLFSASFAIIVSVMALRPTLKRNPQLPGRGPRVVRPGDGSIMTTLRLCASIHGDCMVGA